MLCPFCKTTSLQMSERQGIEIDYCPTCRGVWLDRGELDKIIERSGVAAPSASVSPPPAPPRASHGYEQRHDDRHSGYGERHGGKRKKKEGFLSELFDF